MQAVCEGSGEQLDVALRESGAEQRRAGDVEDGVLTGHRSRQERSRVGSPHSLLREESDRDRRDVVGNPRDPAVPGQADPPGQGRGQVVGVAFEPAAECKELLRVGLATRDRARGDQSERHGRGARTKPALTGNPVGELEAEPVR